MTPFDTSVLIAKAGGDVAFGRLLGIDKGDGWVQRVNNWKRRGIPSAVELEHHETIQQLLDAAPEARTGTS